MSKHQISKDDFRLNDCICLQSDLLGKFLGPYEEEMKGLAGVIETLLGKVDFAVFKTFNNTAQHTY